MRLKILLTKQLAEEFPIPMRGNEPVGVELMTISVWFPIPMRGNEGVGLLVMFAGEFVPNPHEG